MNVLVTDQDQMPATWIGMSEAGDTATLNLLPNKLPSGMTLQLANETTDEVVWQYQTQQGTLECGPYNNSDPNTRQCQGTMNC